MAYKNTGYQRATTLTVRIYENDVLTSSNVLPLMSAFTQSGVTYPAITSEDVQKMPLVDYQLRVSAYAAYVEANYQSQYPGLAVSVTGSRVVNTTACPLS